MYIKHMEQVGSEYGLFVKTQRVRRERCHADLFERRCLKLELLIGTVSRNVGVPPLYFLDTCSSLPTYFCHVYSDSTRCLRSWTLLNCLDQSHLTCLLSVLHFFTSQIQLYRHSKVKNYKTGKMSLFVSLFFIIIFIINSI